jgi:biopolymer transport protein ExbD
MSKASKEFLSEDVKLELTPMIDMAFLIIIFFMCLPFKTLEGKLAAFLPTDKGINPIPQPPATEIKVQIHIVGRKLKEQKWGPGGVDTIQKPTEFRYRRGSEAETADIEDVAGWIKAAKAAAGNAENTKVIGEIKAGHRVPHKYVVAVLNKFAEAKMEKVDFYGTAVPSKALKEKPRLPYPTTDYGGMNTE